MATETLASTSPVPDERDDAEEANFNLASHGVDEDLLKPLWIASKITKYPWATCCLMFALMMIFSVLDALVFALSGNETRAFFVEEDAFVIGVDAWTLAAEDAGTSDENTDALPQTEEAPWMTVQYMFQLRDYDRAIDASNPNDTDYWILTPDNLKLIVEYENRILEDEEWSTYYCYVEDTKTYDCDYFSLAHDVAEYFGYDYSNMTESEIKAYIKSAHDALPTYVEAAFNTEYADTRQTYIYRAFFTAGLPIPEDNGTNNNGTIVKTSKYSNDEDDYDAQEVVYNEWAVDEWIDITVDHDANLKDGELRIVVLIYSVYSDYFNVILLSGFQYIFFAVGLVLVWMTVHLQSCFLSCLSVFQILLSFPFAYFIYYYVYQVSHYDNLSLLIVFVLLGVGADDVFVFTDAWHQSLHFVPNKHDLEQRMTFAYRRASKAMLVTQVTTFFAFLATSFSLIMPISAFGIWAATIVGCNYMLVITMYPAIVLIHHKYVLPYESKCYAKIFPCCCKKPDENLAHVEKNIELEQVGDKTPVGNTSASAPDGTGTDEGGNPLPALERAPSVEEQAAEYRALEKFFGVTWVTFVAKFANYLLVFFAILFGLAMWQATGIEAQDESEEWFNDDHYMAKATDLAALFSASEEDGLVEVFVVWGVDGVDRGDSSKWDPADYGKVEYDSDFDMSSAAAQQWLYDTCYNLSLSDLVYKRDSVVCPMEIIENYTLSLNETFPWTYMDESDSDFSDDTQKEQFAWFIYNFTQESTLAYEILSKSLVFVELGDEDAPQIHYIAMQAFCELSWDDAASDSTDVRDEWVAWLKDNFSDNDDCPEGVSNPLQASWRWAWLQTMQEFVRSAVQGILIAMPLAFVVLIFSTKNWMMACFATFDILGIMSCELAVMALQGWKFGVSESIAIVIIIGFSVDYVVHLANAYLESTSPLRFERLSFSLLTMGISVASGAVTTFLAGLMLIFPEIVFFQKMGILIMTTICFSIFWAMLFFVAILSKWGPEHDKGTIPFGKLFGRCRKQEE